jgi:hypothetical protein
MAILTGLLVLAGWVSGWTLKQYVGSAPWWGATLYFLTAWPALFVVGLWIGMELMGFTGAIFGRLIWMGGFGAGLGAYVFQKDSEDTPETNETQ